MNANAEPLDEAVDDAIVAAIEAHVDVRVEQEGGSWTLVMRREYAQAPERLWAMLTEPELLAKWSPVVPDRPLTSVGPATCIENPGDEPHDAEVLLVDPPRALTHRWGSEVLGWTIEPSGSGSILELRQSLSERSAATQWAASGWHVCLGRLGAEDGTPHERVVGMRAMDYGWEALRERYEAQLGGAGSGEA